MTVILKEAGNLDLCTGQAASLAALLIEKEGHTGLVDHGQAFSLYHRAMIIHVNYRSDLIKSHFLFPF